jgi:hypothetical protein
MIVKNAVNLTLEMNAFSDEDLIDRLRQLIIDFDLHGVRSNVSSFTGITTIERREVSKEQYIAEVHEAVARIRESGKK